MNIKKLLRQSERGQAMAEYTVLFPPTLLLTILILIPISERANYIFCQMVNALDPSVCEVWGEEPGEDDEAATLDDDCVILDEEQGASQCDQSEDCALLPGLNFGAFVSSDDINSFVIKAGVEYHIYETGLTNDGCYMVDILGPRVTWQLVGGDECKDISNAQAWKTRICQ